MCQFFVRPFAEFILESSIPQCLGKCKEYAGKKTTKMAKLFFKNAKKHLKKEALYDIINNNFTLSQNDGKTDGFDEGEVLWKR